MTKSNRIAKRVRYEQPASLDNIFEDFREQMERALRPWHSPIDFPALFEGETRMPLCDMTDRGDSYELQLEVPGIEKDKINVRATASSVEISAEKSEKTEEKKKNYVYSERSHRSFYRRVPIPGEILPSRIDARMNNGLLVVKLPKKNPARSKEQSTKVEVK